LHDVKASRDALQHDFDELMNTVETFQGTDNTAPIDDSRLPEMMRELQAENKRLQANLEASERQMKVFRSEVTRTNQLLVSASEQHGSLS